MTFEDVVHNGVLQAHKRIQRGVTRRDVEVGPEVARRLLKYKGERLVRSMAQSSGDLHIIFD